MTAPSPVLYFRCLRAQGRFVVGDVYPGWHDADQVSIAYEQRSYVQYDRTDPDLWLDFRPATGEEFDASVDRAVQGVSAVGREQADFVRELGTFNGALLSAGECGPLGGAPEAGTSLQAANPAGAIRNRAHALKRKAGELAAVAKEKKEYLEAKLGQRLAAAMASLGDMQKLVERMEEAISTISLYLGRDEQVVCLRDGTPAPAESPLFIRQNVLTMDEEVALAHSHGIDFSEIGLFDKWLLAAPENLAQVCPEQKCVVVLRVRRFKKQYDGETLTDALANAEKNRQNAKSYWLIRNGERLHRIYADIWVRERLLPRRDEIEHFFYEKDYSFREDVSVAASPKPLRPGSKSFIEAMDRADAIRRHYLRLLMVLQGLVDRTLLLAPFPSDQRPNLLDPDSWGDQIRFVRDAEDVVTDGRPTFREWQRKVNEGVEHGHRIVGYFPTSFGREETPRTWPRNADGVNDEDVHTIYERQGELYFSFHRSDTIYRRSRWNADGGSGPAKTMGTYMVERDDHCFVCVDRAEIADMEYYLRDRRHRKEYEVMVPTLQKAIAFKQAELTAERLFRDLLERKLNEATPEAPVTPDQIERLIFWYKTKTREHRALLENDGRAFRMILARHRMASDAPANVTSDKDAFLATVGRMPDALLAVHVGGHDYIVLRTIADEPYFVQEDVWRVTRGTPHVVGTKPFVLAQKAHYATFTVLHETPAWQARPAILDAAKHLSPAHYPALVDFVRDQPWFRDRDGDGTERVVAVYLRHTPLGTRIRAASFDTSPSSGGWGFQKRKEPTVLDRSNMPSGSERTISWSGGRQIKFRYGFDCSTATFCHHDELSLGWTREGARPLFVDNAVLDEMRATINAAKAHDARCVELCEWIATAVSNAKAVLEQAWRARQFAKYSTEGGETEFFEDHLRTLPKTIPSAEFVDAALRRAILAGQTPEQLSSRPFHLMLAEMASTPASNAGEDDDDDDAHAVDIQAEALAQLRATEWTPPALVPESAAA